MRGERGESRVCYRDGVGGIVDSPARCDEKREWVGMAARLKREEATKERRGNEGLRVDRERMRWDGFA